LRHNLLLHKEPRRAVEALGLAPPRQCLVGLLLELLGLRLALLLLPHARRVLRLDLALRLRLIVHLALRQLHRRQKRKPTRRDHHVHDLHQHLRPRHRAVQHRARF
jgi:hypothetical protein